MSAIRLQDAIGEIRDSYIAEAHPDSNQPHIRSKKWIAVILAAVILALAGMVCAPILFNSLSGGELSFDSNYNGNGIVEIVVESKSDKTIFSTSRACCSFFACHGDPPIIWYVKGHKADIPTDTNT